MTMFSPTNVSAFIAGVLPLIVVVVLYKRMQPRYHGLWIFGASIILFAAFVAGLLSHWMDFVPTLLDLGAISQERLNQIQAQLSLWIYLGPAVTAAIGTNLVTEFMVREKPKGE